MTYTAKAGLASTRGLQDSYYNCAHGLKKNRNIKRREMEAVSQGSESYNLGSEISPLLHIRFYCNTATHPFVYELSMAAFMLLTGRLVVTEAIWPAEPLESKTLAPWPVTSKIAGTGFKPQWFPMGMMTKETPGF